MELLYTILSVVVCMKSVLGYGRFRDLIPNGWEARHPCPGRPKWNAVGHMGVDYVPTKNLFGQDARTTKVGRDITWNEWLCRQDSDGDGLTNGEELGDPNCVWRSGMQAPRQARGHPGFCERGRRTCRSQRASHSECPFSGSFTEGSGQMTHKRAPPGSNEHPQTLLTKGFGFGATGFGQPGSTTGFGGQRGAGQGFGAPGFGGSSLSSPGMSGAGTFGTDSVFTSRGAGGSRGSAVRGFGMALPGTSFPGMAGTGPVASPGSSFWTPSTGRSGSGTSPGFDTLSTTLQQPYLHSRGGGSMSGGMPPTGMFAETAVPAGAMSLGGPSSSGFFMGGSPTSGGPPSPGMFMGGSPMSGGPPPPGMFAGGPPPPGILIGGPPPSGIFMGGATPSGRFMGGPRPPGMLMGRVPAGGVLMGGSSPRGMFPGGPGVMSGRTGMTGPLDGRQTAIERLVQERMRLARLGRRSFRPNIGSAVGGVRIPLPSMGGASGPQTPFFMGSRRFSSGPGAF